MRRADDTVMRLRIRLLHKSFMRANLRTREELVDWWERRYFSPRSVVRRRAAKLEAKRLAGTRSKRPRPMFYERWLARVSKSSDGCT